MLLYKINNSIKECENMNKNIKELNKELEGIIMGENEIAKLKDKAMDYKVIEFLDKVLITVQKIKI